MQYSDLREIRERWNRLLPYTLLNGKKVRGLTTIMTYKMMEKSDNLTRENIKRVNILGWCIEMMQSCLLIIDDIVDNSEFRRKAPCWYKQEGVGNLAIFDASILDGFSHVLLKKYFSSHPYYLQMVDLFRTTPLIINMGQILDSTSVELEKHTMERYINIARYKTGFDKFWCPVTLGLYFSKTFNKELHKQITPTLLEMGIYSQMQNDYDDCFGDPDVTGKYGTDIQEGKCTWLSARVLQEATPSQRKIMKEHFGKPNEESVDAVKMLYKELKIPESLEIYEAQSYAKICEDISHISNESLQNVLHILANKLYNR
ncbi:hypothetical protein NQ317_013287 [Molorchus minor]|uniref:Farnesyl pyrophosphate synthase n=1 Tax=Molorchus minor TaxID=1323400 RepID=A0ABQ9JTS5_9CUCU|nr:hypothetical protein NQ317_013287 [Molorchus minor]